MIHLLRKQRAPSAVLGLALDGGRLEGVVVRRSNGSLQVPKSFSAALALNPLTGDPELVGREIRNHLDQAGIRERRCAVCLPLSWALSLRTEVPDLPEEDVASLLQLEAERGFPYGPEALLVSTSRCRASGKQYATQVAIPRSHLLALEKALKAAQLKSVSFSIGIASLQKPDGETPEAVAALALGENSVDLQVTCGGGLAALRALDGVFETEGVKQRLSAELLARELRITLGQLPAELRQAAREVRVFGRGESAQRFTGELAARAESMGIKVVSGQPGASDGLARMLPPGTEVSPALALAASCVRGRAPALEFLPPKTTPWQQVTTRFSSRKLVWVGATAGAAALLLGAAFLVQTWRLSRLERRWAAIRPQVEELDGLQQQIKKFRPWFDESFRSLTILRQLTEAFPEDGVVAAKTVEIREQAAVTCTGVARSQQAFLRMMDQLRAAPEVSDLKVDQLRGETALQFTFNFHWGEGRGREN